MDTNIHILTSKKYKGPRCQSFDPMCSHASASTGESSRGWWTWPNPRDVPEDWGSYTRLDRDKQGSCIFRRNPYTKHGWSRLNGRPQVWCYWLLPRSSVKPDLKGFLFCFSFTDIELVCRKKPAHKSWIHFVYNLNICIHLCYPHHNQRDQYSQHLPKFLYVPLMLLMVVHVCVHMCEEHLPWDLLCEQTFKCTIPYYQP